MRYYKTIQIGDSETVEEYEGNVQDIIELMKYQDESGQLSISDEGLYKYSNEKMTEGPSEGTQLSMSDYYSTFPAGEEPTNIVNWYEVE